MAQTKRQNVIFSTILHKIYTNYTISRIDIARETGLTPATVSLTTAELLDGGLIQELDGDLSDHDSVGRKKILPFIPY